MEEVWKDVVNYAGFYEVSNTGKIRSVSRIANRKNGRNHQINGRELKFKADASGYFRGAFCVDKKMFTYKVHREVAKAFIPNPENKETVNHIDGNKQNNSAENLEWNTRRENLEHAVKTGLIGENSLAINFLSKNELSRRNITPKSRLGENNASAKITELQAMTIITMINSGFKLIDISRKYNISKWIIHDINRKKTWKHLHGICKDQQTKGSDPRTGCK